MAEVVLFDLDGTLTDSGPGIMNSVRYALEAFGIAETDERVLRRYVGPPLKDSFMNFAGLSEERAEAAIAKYRERYAVTGIFENAVYEGIPELLRYLCERGVLLGVASSKPEVFVNRILEHFRLRDYFQVTVGSELDGRRTDKAEVIEEALARLGYSSWREAVIMVGDRFYDVQGAASCGIACAGAAFGYGGREELERAGACPVCDTAEELKVLADR